MTPTDPRTGTYDRFTTPLAKEAPAGFLSSADKEKQEIHTKRWLGIWGGIMFSVLAIVIFHASMVETVVAKSGSNLSADAVNSLDSLAMIEGAHLNIINDIKDKLNESLMDDDPDAGDDMDAIVKYLGEVHSKLDIIKDRQRELSNGINLAPQEQIIPPAVTFKLDETLTTPKREETLEFQYMSKHKLWPFVGDKKAMDRQKPDSRNWFNAWSVFPYADDTHRHGFVGLKPDGSRWWRKPSTPPVLVKGSPEEKTAMERGGGFYLELSDATDFDRIALDSRDKVCKDYGNSLTTEGLPDMSVIITFFNEPLSTLLRSVHSVLNTTPPEVLREIILVDDHSNLGEALPGGPLYEAINYLPKVKIMRLPHRHGLVQARLAGIKDATGEVVTILDSHIECNPGWAEPLLVRLKESPKSLVYPQIPAIDSVDLQHTAGRGIGCKLSFKWIMQEQSTAVSHWPSPDPIPSASMAGGLFAVYRDFFWHMGGYDEGFTMWGAENVEMPFRYWMCGARVECVPCSRVYHIYRNKGTGYKTPSDSVIINRLRTAYLWTDEFYPLSSMVINNGKDIDIGEVDTILELKDRLQCKDFNWFKETLQITKQPKSMDSISLVGQIKLKTMNMCWDNLSNKSIGDPFGTFGCHGGGGTQAFLSFGDGLLLPAAHENLCLTHDLTHGGCPNHAAGHVNKDAKSAWAFDAAQGQIMKGDRSECMAYDKLKRTIYWATCDPTDDFQHWEFSDKLDTNYTPPTHSEQWLKEHPRV